ncbi:unnamed protein product, partial [Rotaria sordida]
MCLIKYAYISRENEHYNLTINFDNNTEPLKTPPLSDLYNTTNNNNNNNNLIFDFEVELGLSSVPTNTFTETQPIITPLENQIPSVTTINDFSSQPSSSLED